MYSALQRPTKATTNTHGNDAQVYRKISDHALKIYPDWGSSYDEMILEELELKCILNLSIHFRDSSPRGKLFAMYSETRTR